MIEDYGDLLDHRDAAEPILARPIRNALLEWLTEVWAEDDLIAVGLKARRKAMFCGPPGCGKTSLAHHLAARLGLDMLVVQPERLIDKWLGSTGRNIGALFDEAAKQDIVVLIDEFDAIGMKRKDADSGGADEQNAWVNTLLQRIERYPGFLIAATNFPKRIDEAAFRRFDIQITLGLPGQFERERIIERYLAPYGLPGTPLKALAESFDTATPALMRQFCEAIKRQLIIGPKVGWNMHRDAVIERILAVTAPHPDLGKPRLWSLMAADPAIRDMPWPPPKADEIPAEEPVPEPVDKVVPLRRDRP